MGSKMGDGKGSMASETTLRQKGMQTRIPSASDASTKLGKASVNEEATRSSTAPTPRTLGDRCA